MKVKEIYPNLFLFTYPNQYELASTFIRLQEFYESPYKQIRNKYFTLEKFMDLYAKDQKKNKFTYFEDWSGYNIPGDIVLKFLELFQNDLTKKERKLLNRFLKTGVHQKFYIIGTIKGDKNTIKHEIAHGLYYLNKDYNKEMSQLIKEMPKSLRSTAEKYLMNLGYCKAVLKDELQAYFATGLDRGMIYIGYHVIFQYYIQRIKRVFKKYYKEFKQKPKKNLILEYLRN